MTSTKGHFINHSKCRGPQEAGAYKVWGSGVQTPLRMHGQQDAQATEPLHHGFGRLEPSMAGGKAAGALNSH